MVRVYGSSDDIVEIEPSGTVKASEIDCYDKDVRITFKDGTVIRIGYGKPGRGIWYVRVEKKGTAKQRLTICEDEHSGLYSDLFSIDADVETYELVKHVDMESSDCPE